jgi:TolB-like protein/DNA-binding winged helix-turn-helix (wHTH) protein
MPSDLLHGFRVGHWKIEPLKGTITGPDDESCHLQPKVMDVLVCLAARANEPVTRDELLKEVWGEHAVSDEPLTHAIGELRRALQDDRGHPKYIKTIPKRGYRLIRAVRMVDRSAGQSATEEQGPEIGTVAIQGNRFFKHPVATFGAVGFIAIVVIFVVFDKVVMTSDTAGETISEKLTVAVLPFDDLSRDGAFQYLADGLTDDLITQLAQVKKMSITARRTVFAFKGATPDARDLGASLNVRYVVEGSLRPIGDQLRFTVQLIDSQTGNHLWAAAFDRSAANFEQEVDNLLDVVMARLQREILGDQAERLVAIEPESMTAQQLVDRAVAWLVIGPTARGAADDGSEAPDYVDYATRALRIEPDNARALAIHAAGLEYSTRVLPPDKRAAAGEEALPLANRALALAPNDPVVAYLAAFVQQFNGSVGLPMGLQLMSRAAQLDPFNSHPLAVQGLFVIRDGLHSYSDERIREGVQLVRNALSDSPDHPNAGLWSWYIGQAFLYLDETASAIPFLRRATESNPSNTLFLSILAIAYARNGQEAEAMTAVDQAMSVVPNITISDIRREWSHSFRNGRTDKIEARITVLRELGFPE